MKPTNKKLGIYTLPIVYLGDIRALIERGKVSLERRDSGYVGPLARKGRETGAFKYNRGSPGIVKERDMEIIRVNEETFKIQIL